MVDADSAPRANLKAERLNYGTLAASLASEANPSTASTATTESSSEGTQLRSTEGPRRLSEHQPPQQAS